MEATLLTGCFSKAAAKTLKLFKLTSYEIDSQKDALLLFKMEGFSKKNWFIKAKLHWYVPVRQTTVFSSNKN